MQKIITTLGITGFLLGVFISAHSADDPLESAVDTRIKGQQRALKSQKQVDELVEETRDMLQEYRSTIRSTDSLKIYNKQLAKLTSKQQEEL
ncbi:MAG: DUF3450 family protein, partial [Gammaproteobacteria bacterium]|nr:DUF3450 family protein [Gammaproteobacteria bacterium]